MFGLVFFGEPPPCKRALRRPAAQARLRCHPAISPGRGWMLALLTFAVAADFLGDQPFPWLRERLQPSGRPQRPQLCQRFPKDSAQMSPVLLQDKGQRDIGSAAPTELDPALCGVRSLGLLGWECSKTQHTGMARSLNQHSPATSTFQGNQSSSMCLCVVFVLFT